MVLTALHFDVHLAIRRPIYVGCRLVFHCCQRRWTLVVQRLSNSRFRVMSHEHLIHRGYFFHFRRYLIQQYEYLFFASVPQTCSNTSCECSSTNRLSFVFWQNLRSQVAMQPRVGKADVGQATTVAPARPPGKEGPHLPWTGSMAGPEFPLTYMPFMEHLLNTLARSFGEMTALPLADKLAFVENSEKQARMVRLVSLRCVRVVYHYHQASFCRLVWPFVFLAFAPAYMPVHTRVFLFVTFTQEGRDVDVTWLCRR